MRNLRVNHSIILLFLFSIFCAQSTIAAGITGGTYPIGPGQTYTTLGAFATALNGSTLSSNVIAELQSDYVDASIAATISFTGWTGGTYTVTIRPSASVSSILYTAGIPAANTPLISLTGATVKYLIFDGRPGGTGSTSYWTIQNRATASIGPVFNIITNATYNTLEYLEIQGGTNSSTANMMGVIDIGSASVAGGNSYNTITYCKIHEYSTSYYPWYTIYASGTSGYQSNNLTITYNQFYNFSRGGIYAATGVTGPGNNWDIEYNHFYNANNVAPTNICYGIYYAPVTSSTGGNISNNYIGGHTTNCGNPIWAVSSSYTGLYPIYIAGQVSNLQINNNTIQNIQLTGSSGTYLHSIYIASTGTYTINGNTIGHPTTAAQGLISSCQYSIMGIYNAGAGTISITNNTIANLQSSYAGTSAYMYGIYTTSGTNTLSGNTIHDLSSANTYVTDATVAGIFDASVTASAQTISSNTIYNLSNTQSGSYAFKIIGIEHDGGSAITTNIIEKNKIYNISLSTSNTAGEISGIKTKATYATTVYTVKNNMIRLGYNTSGAITAGYSLIGINIPVNTYSNYYFNTVYIGGTGVTSVSNTYAFYTTSTATNARYIEDNIFWNARSNSSGIAKNYAIKIYTSTGLTSNYNILYANGTGNVLGVVNTTDYASFSDWQGIPLDANSQSTNPYLIDPTSLTAPDLHLSATNPAEGTGIAIGSITDDFDGEARASYTPTDIGADAGNYTFADLNPPSLSYTTLANTSNTSAPSLTATISDASGINTTSGTAPRLYYKRLTDANAWVDNTNTTNGWKWVECTSPSGNNFTFNIDYSKIFNSVADPVAAGDFVQYFVITQDMASTPNVTINSGTAGSGSPASVADYASLFGGSGLGGTINQYWILPKQGTYTIGTGGQPTYNYATLTAANGFFAGMNDANTVLSGSITILVSTNISTEDGTNSLNQWTGASYSVTVNPSGSRTVSGTVAGAPLININGADNLIIDGLNTGGNSLVISNLSTSATAATSTIRFITDATNNTITNCSILGSTTAPLATNGGNIFISTGTSTGNDNITISNCLIGPAGANLPSKGIYGSGSTGSSAIANSNVVINNCEIYDFFLTGGCAGVYALTGNTDWSITINKIYQTASRTFTSAGTLYGIYFANSTYGNNIQITGNTIGYSNNTGTGTLTLLGSGIVGAFQGIYLSSQSTAAVACNMNNNVISDISFTSSTGSFYGIYCASSASSNTININSNTIRNIASSTTTGTINGIYSGSATTQSVNGNTINNITRTGSGIIYGIWMYSPTTATFNSNIISNLAINNTASTSTIYGIYGVNSSVNVTANGNNIFNLTTTSTTTATICALREYGASGNKVFQNNTINNLSAGGGATIYGIWVTGVSSPNPLDISGNIINTFSGGIEEKGIYHYSASTTSNIYKNKIYDLSTANASPTVYGIYVNAGTTNNVYNNIIGDLRTTAANVVIPLVGIYINLGTTNNIYYNTVYLNATSSNTNFGSAGLYATTAPTVNMRNNIIVNTSTAKGTGYTVAYQRSTTTLTTYAATSNNNLFYAGTPGAKYLIMYDGTNSYQTLAAYKTAVGPTRDASSVTENPTWLSNTGADASYLHIDPSVATQIESGGASITSYTDDYDGDTRCPGGGCPGSGSYPDIGADEGDFLNADHNPPTITYTVLANTSNAATASLTATVTDASGINSSSGTAPRLYYKRLTDANAWGDNTQGTNGWKWVECTTPSGNNYTLNMDYSLIYNSIADPITAGDYIQYFVVAQDLAAVPNVGINSGTFAAAPSSVALTTAAFPIGGTINQYWILPSQGIYTTGPGGQPTYNYATLTTANGFFAGMNDANTIISGNITMNITADITTEDGTNGLNQWTESPPSNVFTVTIKPSASAARSVYGTCAGGLFRFNGCDRVTFDGSNGTTNRYLTVYNSTAAQPTFVFINDATNNTLNYCNIYSSNTTAASGTILFSTSTGTSGNDNNTISNCDIYNGGSVPANAIYSAGTAAKTNSDNIISGNIIRNFTASGINISATNNGDNWVIGGINASDGNNVYNEAARSTALVCVFVGMGSSHIIRNNSIYHNAAANTNTFTGIQVAGSGNGITIRDNYIGGTQPQCGGTALPNSYSGAGAFIGITAAVGTATDAEIHNNTIQNIVNSGAASSFTGIAITAGIANIGAIAGNLIGHPTSAASITLAGSGATSPITLTGSGNGSDVSNNIISGFTTSSSNAFVGITLTVGTITSTQVQGNTIKKITMNGNVASTFKGIYVTAGKVNIGDVTPNNIGDASLSDYSSITYAGSSTCYGIYSTASAASVISNNNIANIFATYNATGTGVQLVGIYHSASIGMTLSGNTIKYLKSNYGNTTTIGATPSVIGISFTSATAPVTISQNTIHTLKNVYTATSVVSYVEGIYASLPTSGSNVVSRNFIHSFYIQNVNAGDGLCGIYLAAGLYTCDNNMIRLGIDDAGADINNNYLIYGIYQASATATSNIYFNSVYIGGSAVGAGAVNTYGLYRSNTIATNVKNNIFMNARSNNTGTGTHYAIYISATTGYTADNNLFYFSGTGGKVGLMNATPCSDLTTWRTNSGQDANSYFGDAVFITPAGTNASVNLHLKTDGTQTLAESNAVVISMTDDYDATGIRTGYPLGGQSNGGGMAPDIGADEGDFAPFLGGTYTWIATSGSGDWQVATNWTPTRSMVNNNDILQFINGGTPTATNIPTEIIKRLIIAGNTNASLQAAATNTLTINGPTATANLSVESGSTLQVGTGTNTLTISSGSTSGQLASIAGTLIVNANGTYTPSNLATTFSTGATFIHNRDGGAVPPATWSSGSACTVSSPASGPTAGLNQTFDNFTLNTGASVTTTTSGGTMQTNGTLTLTNGKLGIGGALLLVINGDISVGSGSLTGSSTSDITIGGTASNLTLPAVTNNLRNLTISRASGVSLGAPLSLSSTGVLTFTNGLLTTSATNLLTVSNTATSAITGYSSTTYVKGPLARTLPTSYSGGGTYVFPVGKTAYNLFELVNPTTNATIGIVTVEVFDANSGGVAGFGLSAINTNRYWASSSSASSITATTIRLTEPSLGGANRVGQSATLTGAYDARGGSAPSPVLSTAVGTALNYFVLGTGNTPTLCGTYTVGASGTFSNLTAVASALNTYTVTCDVIFELQSDYNGTTGETFPITFNQYAMSKASWTVTIRPASSVSTMLTTSGTTSSLALINLSGIDLITFDGRPGGTGDMTNIKWSIQNTAAGTSYPAIQLIDGASNDVLQYMQIKASGTNTTGTILLSTSTVSGGNSNNTIQYCDIGNYSTEPYNGILSIGSTAPNSNSSNSILNNNIYNFRSNTSYASWPLNGGIVISKTGNGNNWTISGNSLYANISNSGRWGYSVAAIFFGPGSSIAPIVNSTGNVISGNYIGGQAPKCAGDYWYWWGEWNGNGFDFFGIFTDVGTTGTVDVTNNTVQNIKMSMTTMSQHIVAINHYRGAATISNNTVGSGTQCNSIWSGNYGAVYGIMNQSSAAVTITNNVVGNLTSDNTNPSSSYNQCGVCGITCNPSGMLGACTVTNNTVFNLSNADNYNGSYVITSWNFGAGGGANYGPMGDINAKGMSINSQFGGQNIMIVGIYIQSTTNALTHTISNNTVYGLHNTVSGGTWDSYIIGIFDNVYSSGGTINLNANKVFGLYTDNYYGVANTNYIGLIGIFAPPNQTGTHNITNNFVSLGYKPSGASQLNASITGIWDNSDWNNHNLVINVYHNTVLLGGTDATKMNTYAFRRSLIYGSTVYDLLNVKNNVFVNNRSGANCNNYGLFLNDNLDAVSNYNDVYGTGTGYLYGNEAGVDYANRSAWNTATGLDANSIEVDPLFQNSGMPPDLHIKTGSPIINAGTNLGLSDYDGEARSNPPDIGADEYSSGYSSPSLTMDPCEGTVPFPVELLSFEASADDDHVDLKWSTASETNNDYFTIERSKTADDFEKLIDVDGAGNSNSILHYYTVDENPLPGLSYYRLKQVDYDGAFTYSEIRSVFFGDDSGSGILNSWVDDMKNLNILFQSGSDDNILVTIYNSEGVLVFNKEDKCIKGLNTIQLNQLNLASGIYILKLQSSQTVFSDKFMIP
jgi:hypothetical protein